MYSVKFYLRANDGLKETALYLYITYNRRRIKIPSGIKIESVLWDAKNQCIITDGPLRLKVNRTNPGVEARLVLVKAKISEMRKVVDDYFTLSHINNEKIDLDKLQEKILAVTLNKKISNPDTDSVTAFIETFIAQARTGKRKLSGLDYSPGTIKNYSNLLQALLRFQRDISKQLRWAMIDKSLYAEFMEWQTNEGFSINYCGKHVKDLKAMMRCAYEEGCHRNDSFRSKWFAVPRERSAKYPLTIEEMDLLFEHPLKPGSTKCIARDVFLIGCYTALRVSDIKRINKSMIIELEDGRKMLRIKAQKNKIESIIPLSSKCNTILKKYEYKCPYFTEKTVNKLIKPLAVESGIKAEKANNLSIHIGRHSMATHLRFVENMPYEALMQLTGHATERNLRIYLTANPEEIAKNHLNTNFFK